MVTNTPVVIDGVLYHAGEDVPDFGSIRTMDINGRIHEYEGLSADKGKLPTYCGTGSTFFSIDTGTLYEYEETTAPWIEL